MTSLKEEVIKSFADLPNRTTVDEMMYRLYVIDRIRRGEKDILEGKVLTQSQIEEAVKKW